MRTSRHGRRRTAWVLGIVALLVLGLFVYIQRRPLLERYWIWKLETGEKGDKKRAAEKLGEIRSLAAIPSLVEAFRESPGSAERLSQFGVALVAIGPPAVEPLLSSIDLQNARLCECIAYTLFRIGLDDYSHFLTLMRQYEDEDPGVTLDMDLGYWTPILARLSEGTADQRALGIWAWGQMANAFWHGKAGYETLRPRDPEGAGHVFEQILVPYAKAKVPKLLVALEDESVSVRREAARTLGSLRWLAGPEAVEALTGLEDDPDVSVRQAVIAALEEIRRSAPNAEGSAPEGSDRDCAVPSDGTGQSNQ